MTQAVSINHNLTNSRGQNMMEPLDMMKAKVGLTALADL